MGIPAGMLNRPIVFYLVSYTAEDNAYGSTREETESFNRLGWVGSSSEEYVDGAVRRRTRVTVRLDSQTNKLSAGRDRAEMDGNKLNVEEVFKRPLEGLIDFELERARG